MLVPVLGQELTHVQYRSLDEQLFRAMAILLGQGQQQCVARLVGLKAPVSLLTPTLESSAVSRRELERYRRRVLARLPFALSLQDAMARLREREKFFLEQYAAQAAADQEPQSVKRRIRSS